MRKPVHALFDGLFVTSRKIHSTDALGEYGVATEKRLVPRPIDADSSGSVPGRQEHLQLVLPENKVTFLEVEIHSVIRHLYALLSVHRPADLFDIFLFLLGNGDFDMTVWKRGSPAEMIRVRVGANDDANSLRPEFPGISDTKL
jgi:hypothetical protein